MAKEITKDESAQRCDGFRQYFVRTRYDRRPAERLDEWVSEWRSGAMVAFRAADGHLYWKAGDRELEP